MVHKQILEEASLSPVRNTSAASYTARGRGLRARCPAAGLVGFARSQAGWRGGERQRFAAPSPQPTALRGALGALDVPVREAPGQAFLGPLLKGLGPSKHGGKVP